MNIEEAKLALEEAKAVLKEAGFTVTIKVTPPKQPKAKAAPSEKDQKAAQTLAEQFKVLLEEAPSSDFDQITTKATKIFSKGTIKQLKMAARDVGITLLSSFGKPEIVRVFVTPIRARAVDATRKADFW